jgi:hypothetical protein
MNSIDWLYANAGPIIRWRLIQDYQLPVAKKEKETLLQEVVSHPDVQNWLQLLGSRYVHGSKTLPKTWREIESTFRMENIKHQLCRT